MGLAAGMLTRRLLRLLRWFGASASQVGSMRSSSGDRKQVAGMQACPGASHSRHMSVSSCCLQLTSILFQLSLAGGGHHRCCGLSCLLHRQRPAARVRCVE